jgi:hypothetical protein
VALLHLCPWPSCLGPTTNQASCRRGEACNLPNHSICDDGPTVRWPGRRVRARWRPAGPRCAGGHTELCLRRLKASGLKKPGRPPAVQHRTTSQDLPPAGRTSGPTTRILPPAARASSPRTQTLREGEQPTPACVPVTHRRRPDLAPVGMNLRDGKAKHTTETPRATYGSLGPCPIRARSKSETRGTAVASGQNQCCVTAQVIRSADTASGSVGVRVRRGSIQGADRAPRVRWPPSPSRTPLPGSA